MFAQPPEIAASRAVLRSCGDHWRKALQTRFKTEVERTPPFTDHHSTSNSPQPDKSPGTDDSGSFLSLFGSFFSFPVSIGVFINGFLLTGFLFVAPFGVGVLPHSCLI